MESDNKDQRYDHAVMEHKTISRRGLFRGLFSGVSQAGSKTQATNEPRPAPRPPTAAVESIFARLCNRCGECEQVCPEHVLTMVNGLPELTLDHNSCSECGDCQRSCPTLALSAQVKQTGAYPNVSATCLRRLHSHCVECIEVCPHQALTPNQTSVTLDREQCSGCGQCREACPAMAIAMAV